MASRSYFNFRQFAIRMCDGVMKVGTDAVLIGAWFSIQGRRSMLDIGTGTGVISLMAAQRGVTDITALDINPEAVRQADENISASMWKDTIRCVCVDVSDYNPGFRFDAIVSNPPYFRNALKCPDDDRTTARHDGSLGFEKLIESVTRLLAHDGEFSVIIPAESAEILEKICFVSGLYLNRRTDVVTTCGAMAKRTMMSFTERHGKTPITDLLIMKDHDGNYTPEYRSLVSDFYLNV